MNEGESSQWPRSLGDPNSAYWKRYGGTYVETMWAVIGVFTRVLLSPAPGSVLELGRSCLPRAGCSPARLQVWLTAGRLFAD